jgi:hypothetical protein
MRTGVLSLQTLADACPKAAADFLDRLNAAVLDCKHSNSKKARTVTLKLTIEPRQTDPDDVVITPAIGLKTPSKLHDPFVARSQRSGQLQFDFSENES